MREVGVLAEQGATGYLKEWEIPFGIREREFHSLIRMVIAGETGGQKSTVPAQIITGSPTGGMAHNAGVRRPFFFDDPKFSELAATGLESVTEDSPSPAEAKTSTTKVSLQSLIAEADSITTASDAMTEAIVARVARSLQTSTSEVNASKALHSYGVDSLLAVEIVNWVFQETKVTLSVLEVLATVPISELAMKIVGKTPSFREQSDGE
jgi:zearalenone synthase (highly reducing iterative type I polyketide synthase)